MEAECGLECFVPFLSSIMWLPPLCEEFSDVCRSLVSSRAEHRQLWTAQMRRGSVETTFWF